MLHSLQYIKDETTMRQSKTFAIRDAFFTIIIGLFLASGIDQIHSSEDVKDTLAPSFLLGAAASLISQWWLGGIRDKNDSLEIKQKLLTLQLGGGAAILIGSTCIFSYILHYSHKLAIQSTLKVEPNNYKNLIVFNQKGEAETLTINKKGANELVIPANNDHIRNIKNICTEGKGFCENYPKDVKILMFDRGEDKLKSKNALVCDDNYSQLPLFIANTANNKNIKVSGYKMSKFCPKGSEEYIWLSQEDYNKLEVKKEANSGTIAIVQQKLDYPNRGIFID